MTRRIVGYEGEGRRRRPIWADDGPASGRGVGNGPVAIIEAGRLSALAIAETVPSKGATLDRSDRPHPWALERTVGDVAARAQEAGRRRRTEADVGASRRRGTERMLEIRRERGIADPEIAGRIPLARLTDDEGAYQSIPVELVDVGDNVRADPGDVAELAASIGRRGLLSPIKVVGPIGGRYRLVYGQRRLLAIRSIGRRDITAIVVPADAGRSLAERGTARSLEQLVENLQREDLSPIDAARVLRDALDTDPRLTQAQLATEVGRTGAWVSITLALLELHPEVQKLVASGELSVAHARSIVRLPRHNQLEVARTCVSGKVSAQTLDKTVRRRSHRDVTRRPGEIVQVDVGGWRGHFELEADFPPRLVGRWLHRPATLEAVS
jgi:ParB/RepB/Spo0J family partition protein